VTGEGTIHENKFSKYSIQKRSEIKLKKNQLKERATSKLKTNRSYHTYEGGQPVLNTPVFTLKFYFCPNFLRTTLDTPGPLN